MGAGRATAVVNLHREGPLLPATLRSLLLARETAAAQGHQVEILAVADRPDAPTLAALERFRGDIDRVLHVDHGDLGAARAEGIAAASHDWVFLHDGDDLYSSNWYLVFFEALAAGRIDPRTVWHTEIFARFGDILDLRRIIDSRDPRFHPLFLAAEWYYSNKCVLHRSLIAEFPLPRNSLRTGLGNEDWAWSCDTIHGGVRHSPLPGTVCFYRVKPAAQSLGLTPGMIHGPSRLFAPENVAALTRARAAAGGPRAFADGLTPMADPRIGAEPLPPWFWQEVDRQGAFESLITEFHRLGRRERRLPLPNLNWNVVTAAEAVLEGLDARPKIFLFASLDGLRAADILVDRLLAAAAAHEDGAFQPVLVVDEGGGLAAPARLAAAHGAKVISTRLLTEHFRLGEWYVRRFLMRPLVQFPGSIVLDLGSDCFAALFGQFHRTLLECMRMVRMILPDPVADPCAPALANAQRNAPAWTAHTGGPVPVTVHPAAAHAFPGPLWAPCPMPARAVAALEAAIAGRFADRPPAVAPLLLDDLLAPPVAAPLAVESLPARVRLLARSGAVERLAFAPDGGRERAVYRTAGSWVDPAWFDAAARAFDDDPRAGIALPPIHAEIAPDGRYVCRWLDLARPDLVLSGLFERLRLGVRVPVIAMLRQPLDGPLPDSAEALIRALWAAVRAGQRAAAAGETIAILRDPALYPDSGLSGAQGAPCRKGEAA
ncbi:MAG: hypothetical protein KatS3mg118_1725 [Paracoccaceae bacterium]|nr:MAG: hypothetical protein KatS3mg118_1725 [Paracoccaceae bacterium]